MGSFAAVGSDLVRWLGRTTKRMAVAVAGFVLLLAGAVMMITPGPGMLVILAGLMVLATEFAWACRTLDAARERAARAGQSVRRRARS